MFHGLWSIVFSFPDVKLSSWARLAGCFQLCNVEDFVSCVNILIIFVLCYVISVKNQV